jgi:cellulose biosynthesis protein BcsQ
MILQDRSILAVCKRAGTSIAQACDVILIPAEVFFLACTVLVATMRMIDYLTELMRIRRDLTKNVVPAKQPRRSAYQKAYVYTVFVL